MHRSTPFMVEFSGTPEAGKSTAIATVNKLLEKHGYKTMILKESAESLPREIPKGTFVSNLWMHLITQAGILRAQYTSANIVLIDRGIIDSKFYAWKFLNEKGCSIEQFDEFHRTCLKLIDPDLFLGFLVSPEISIKRRGGEGKLVTEKYVKSFNRLFMEFFVTIGVKKRLFQTDAVSIEELGKLLFNTILEELP